MERTIKRGIILFLLVFLVAGFFAPYLVINGTIYGARELLFCDFTNIYTYVLFLPFILFLIGTIFLLVKKKVIYSTLIFLCFLLSGVFFLLTPYFSSLFLNINRESISLGAYTLMIALLSIGISIYSLRDIFDHNPFTISDMVEIAMFVALAVILDLAIFKFKIVPSGGSISLSMLPLIIIALRKGFFKGFISLGVVYGLLDCILDGYGIITYPLDYLLGFGLLAVVGLFSRYIFNPNKKVTLKGSFFLFLGIMIGCSFRLLASTISGMLLYGMNFVESIIYQLTYIGISTILVLVAIFILYKPLLVINVRYPQKQELSKRISKL